MLGSAIATCISDIPFDGPCATTQIGMIDGEFVVNPSTELREGDFRACTDSSFYQREGYHDRGRCKRGSGR